MNMGTVEAGVCVRTEQRAVLRGELGPESIHVDRRDSEGENFPIQTPRTPG